MVKIMSETKLMMNLALDIYSLMILVAVLISAIQRNADRSESQKIFERMLIAVLFMLFADAMSNFDGTARSFFPVLNKTGNFLIFLLAPVIPGLWALYAASELSLGIRKIRFHKKIFLAYFLVNFLLLIASQFWGWYYHIDADNIYHRGPLNIVFQAVNILVILFPVILLTTRGKSLPRSRAQSLISFALLPIVGIAIQIIFYGFSVTVNFLVFSLLIAHLFIQRESLDTDFLTGIGNRRKLDLSLKAHVFANKPFSAILLDLDNFKQINDKFGHEAGDIALKKAAEILQASVREGDIIARYGGDEFCIITGIDNNETLKECVERIRNNFEKYNENPETEIPLELSIGYLVYGPGKVTVSEFLKKLDQRMYKDKFARKKCEL